MKLRSPITGLGIQTTPRGRKYTEDADVYIEFECNFCKKLLPVVDFYQRKKLKVPCGYCKNCHTKKVNLWRESNPDSVKKMASTAKTRGMIRRSIVTDVLGLPGFGQKNMWDGVGKWYNARKGTLEYHECVFCHTTTWKYHAKGACKQCYYQNHDRAKQLILEKDKDRWENRLMENVAAHRVRRARNNRILEEVEKNPEKFSLKTQNAQDNLDNLKLI